VPPASWCKRIAPTPRFTTTCDIVNVFRVLRDPVHCAYLIDQLLLTPYARDEFYAAYEPTDDPIERARRTLVRAEMGFGSAGATKGTTGFRIDTRRKHGTAQQLWARFPDSLARVCERLSGVMIENRPALSVIEQHDAPDTLFYVDPPYVMDTRNVGARHGRYYDCELKNADHVELLEKLLTVKGMVVLSGYSSAMYVGALQGWVMASVEARISAARGSGIRVECLWMNPAASRALDRTGLFWQEGT
jgi:DNA adenine methylase